MAYQEVYNIINGVENKSANVWITSKVSGKKYKQHLSISSANLLKIKNVGSKAMGYNVTDVMAEKWESVDLCKTRKKKD